MAEYLVLIDMAPVKIFACVGGNEKFFSSVYVPM